MTRAGRSKERRFTFSVIPLDNLIEGVLSDTTDADGKYSIRICILGRGQTKIRKRSGGKFESSLIVLSTFGSRIIGVAKPFYTKIPSTVDVTLKPAAVIEGQVIDQDHGKARGECQSLNARC